MLVKTEVKGGGVKGTEEPHPSPISHITEYSAPKATWLLTILGPTYWAENTDLCQGINETEPKEKHFWGARDKLIEKTPEWLFMITGH